MDLPADLEAHVDEPVPAEALAVGPPRALAELAPEDREALTVHLIMPAGRPGDD